MTAKLSEAAKTALINTTARQGAPVPLGGSWDLANELSAEGLIGEEGGITRLGLVSRQAIVNAKLDELF